MSVEYGDGLLGVVVPQETELLAKVVIASAFAVHSELGPGLLESAYEACLVRELELRGVSAQRQIVVPLHYKGLNIEAGYRADLIVENRLLIELKAIEKILPIHQAQVITYLKILKLPLGLLLNFNERLIKDGIKRVLNTPRRTTSNASA